MDKFYVKHYILATYGEDGESNYRTVPMSEVIERCTLVSERIKRALEANDVENPEKLITYSFRLMGDFKDNDFQRKELIDINLDALRGDLVGFPWENWSWVQAFQPLVDVTGFTIAELDNEYPSFGPTVDSPVDYIAPCYRIHEKGTPEYETGPYTGQKRRSSDHETWFDTFNREFVEPATNAVKDNIPTILAIGTTMAAVFYMHRMTSEVVHNVDEATAYNNEVLHRVEELIEDAIDMPQIVKVEIGEDLEVIGTGRRTW